MIAIHLDTGYTRADMTAALVAYFTELALGDLDPDAIAREFLDDPAVRTFRILAPGPVGLVAIEDYSDFTQLCEFHILPEHRRRGLGTRAAHAAFALSPGRWEIGSLPAAEPFWRHAIATCPDASAPRESPSDNPHQSCIFRFTMPPAPAPRA